jgi:hypothetical protein
MGAIAQYDELFGAQVADMFYKKAVTATKEEREQSGATKLAMYDTVAIDRELAVCALQETYDTLDEANKENEALQANINKYEEVFGVKNDEFLAQYKINLLPKPGSTKQKLLKHVCSKYSSVIQAVKQKQ